MADPHQTQGVFELVGHGGGNLDANRIRIHIVYCEICLVNLRSRDRIQAAGSPQKRSKTRSAAKKSREPPQL